MLVDIGTTIVLVQEDVNMRNELQILKEELGDYVICGSLAFQLHNLEPLRTTKDIDIILDKKELPKDWSKHTSDRFTKLGWSKKIEGIWFDCYSKQLPEYDIIKVEGLDVKVKSVNALISHYLSLDLEKVGGHVRFQKKLKERQTFVQSLR